MRWLPRLGAVCVALVMTAAVAQEVGPQIQAVLFKKIFTYDHAMKADARMLVVCDDPSSSDGFANAAQLLGVEVSQARTATLESSLGGVSTVYFCSRSSPSRSRELLRRNKVLSLAPVAEWAQSGDVAIAIAAQDGKPRMFVNLPLLTAIGHDLPSSLLGFATVIQ